MDAKVPIAAGALGSLILSGIQMLGEGIYRCYLMKQNHNKKMEREEKREKWEKNELAGRMDSLSIGVQGVSSDVSRLSQDISGFVNATTEQVSHIRQDVAEVRRDIQRVLDSQALLVALFEKGVVDLAGRLDTIQAQLDQGFERVVSAIEDTEAVRNARKLKTRLNALTLAYDPLVTDIISLAENGDGGLSAFAEKVADKAEMRADDLYSWASTYLPGSNHAELSKRAKLELMPYIVSMAYAVRVKLDAHLVRSHLLAKDKRAQYLKTAEDIVEKFVQVLDPALMGVTADTSLLEVALDYHLPIATYLTLITTLRSNVHVMVSPETKLEEIEMWDDGLSGIRAILCRDTKSDAPTAIEFDNIEESVWWVQFTGGDFKKLKPTEFKEGANLHELLFVLGADLDDDSTASIRLAPDYKRALLDLPSADDLRLSLQAKLATAVNALQSHQAITSFATTRNATQLAAAASIHTTPLRSRPLPAGPPIAAPLSPRLARTLTGHSADVYGVAVSGDGQRVVSASADHTAKVWNATTGQAMPTFNGHSSCVYCVALFSDTTLAITGSADRTLRMWNINTGTLITTFKGHNNIVYAVAVSPDEGTVASASVDKTVKLWSVHSGQCDATLTGHSDWVRCVAWSADGQTLATGSYDKTIKVWSARSYSLLRTIDHSTQGGHTRGVIGVAFAGDVLVSCSWDSTIKVWKWQSGTLQTTLSEHTSAVVCVAVFDDNERVASGSMDKTVRIWNLSSGECEHTLGGYAHSVLSVAVSRDGRTLVSGDGGFGLFNFLGDRSVKVWTLRDCRERKNEDNHTLDNDYRGKSHDDEYDDTMVCIAVDECRYLNY